MEGIKNKGILIYDFGSAVPIAQRIGRECRVGYFSLWQSGYPTVNDLAMGSGFDNVERIEDFWKAVDDKKWDCIAFFDTNTADISEYLKRHGHKVFAPGKASLLETQRWTARKVQSTVQLPTQHTEKVIGLSNLKKRLSQVKDKFIKLSVFRGELETWKHNNFESSQPFLDKLAVSLGINKDVVEFIIEDPIEGEEWGYDGFVCGGSYSNFCFIGAEIKDTSYIGKVVKNNDLFKPIKEVNDKLAPFFKKCDTQSMFSTEVRITKDGKGFLIDPTVRAPFPPSFVEMEMYENFGEFIYNAAQGKLIDLKPVSTYGVEAIMSSAWSEESPMEVTFPKEMERWVKLASGAKVNGKYYVLPGNAKNHYVSAIGLGKTVDEAINNVQKVIDKIDACQLQKSFDKQSIYEKIKEGRKNGIQF